MAPPRLLIPILSASNFLIGMGAFVIVGVLEPLGADFGITAASAGTLMTVYALAYAVLSPVLVSLTGAVGRRRVMAFGLSLFMGAALLSALAPNMIVLNIARVMAAAGAGVFTPVAAAVAAALYPVEMRARVLAAVFFGLTLAQVVGVPAGSWIAYTFGWRWAFWVVVGLAVPAIALIWIFVPKGLSFQPVSLRDLGGVLRNGRMMLAVLFTGTFLGAIYVLYTYIAPLLSQTMGYGRDGVTLVLAIFGVGAVVGNIAGGILADRVGWARTLVALCLCQMMCMPFFSVLPMGDALLLVLAFAWSVTGWAFMAGQQMRLIGLAGPQAPVVLALNAAAIYVGAALGSAVGAWVIEAFGILYVGLAASVGSALALLHLTLSINRSPAPQSA
ncbi:MFS transporter [uncultured Tateyamaria sp.]|uniref:MFS transporter n=1 Tax=uncultured Tateyamaria sp. TaxID=455651 RepID=UPI00262F8A5D|nr:MFS transporter [uncultured Tateyamaria sp.]